MRIFVASSFTVLKLSVAPVSCPASTIIPLSVFPTSPSSLSVSGKMLTKPVLTDLKMLITGPKLDIMSSSVDVLCSLTRISVRAILALMIVFSILRISISSELKTVALPLSCFSWASTILAKIVLSLAENLSIACSSLCTCSSIRLVRKSSRGFRGFMLTFSNLSSKRCRVYI